MPNKTAYIGLRVEESLHDGIEDLANARGVSVGVFIRNILKRSLRSHKHTINSATSNKRQVIK